MEKSTMSVQELSLQMGVSLPKAYALARSPGFPTIRVGTRILIPVEAFREWLNNAATGMQAPHTGGDEDAWSQ